MTASTSPIVETSTGRVRGLGMGDVAVFQGVPYAAPPVGSLRFAAAEMHPGWPGVLDAMRPGPAAIQAPSRLNGVMGDPIGSLDETGCLTLNVWTPELHGNAPVLFWIHGGAWMSGSASWPWYDGARLAAEQGIVVVTANYRLGAFGYLCLKDLVDPFEGFGPGNAGCSDQVAALRWVAENISLFGGNPDAITVGGQSAGAHSAVRLAEAPETRHIVRRLILQSAAPSLVDQPAAEAAESAARFLAELGIEPGAPARLREAAADELLAAFVRLGHTQSPANPSAPMRVVVTDPDSAARSMAWSLTDGIAAEVPVLAGTTRNEMAAFYRQSPELVAADEDVARSILTRNFGAPGDDLYRTYRACAPEATPGAILEDIAGDGMFLVPLLELAEQRSSAGRVTYVYRFDWSNSPWGACHCIDLPFMFGNLDVWPDSPMLGDATDTTTLPLSRAYRNAFGSFVRSGVPDDEADTAWAAYDANSRITMRFDVESEPIGDLSREARSAFTSSGARPWVPANPPSKSSINS